MHLLKCSSLFPWKLEHKCMKQSILWVYDIVISHTLRDLCVYTCTVTEAKQSWQ